MADSSGTPSGRETTASRRPSLLPAFEPFSSSPGLPRPAKRKLDDILEDRKYYPTPIPTSSTGILPSSPPAAARHPRPALQRTVSTLSERAPLGVVPCLDLPANGEPVLMGRSSSSSDYQLAANRHISRVHVRAAYHAANELFPHGKVEVSCLGWNGAKVHCRGDVVELAKHEVFVSDNPTAQIMIDVQDTRVMLRWPKDETREPRSVGSRSPWVLDSPTKHRPASAAHLASSPPPFVLQRPASPVSPTPFAATFTSTFRADEVDDDGPVKVYEDHSSDEDAPHDPTPEPLAPIASSPSKQPVPTPIDDLVKVSHSTTVSDPEEFSDHNEENDPIIHSFGPFGDNILHRFESFQSTSPERKRKPLASSFNSPGRSAAAPRLRNSPVTNHVINQLAFSRVHSLPLSTIHSNLPAELRGIATKSSDPESAKPLTTSALKSILDDISCVGEISREGKDAAGKLLESEFYYVPEMDADQMRRDTVTQSLGKTSIRAARKQHKVSILDMECFHHHSDDDIF
nr:protein plm2 [Quercus suber]